jgi:hypothetical protein
LTDYTAHFAIWYEQDGYRYTRLQRHLERAAVLEYVFCKSVVKFPAGIERKLVLPLCKESRPWRIREVILSQSADFYLSDVEEQRVDDVALMSI